MPFTHEPRAPHCPASHPDQRYFCDASGVDTYESRWIGGMVRVYRNAARDVADVDIRATAGRVDVQAGASLTPAELRELAHRLLDAAHDLEAFPATVEAGS